MKKKTSRPLFSIIAYDSKYSLCGLLCLLLSYDEVVFRYGSWSRRPNWSMAAGAFISLVILGAFLGLPNFRSISDVNFRE